MEPDSVTTIPSIDLGRLTMPAIGFGASLLSLEPRPDERLSIDIITKILHCGIRLIDTADCYCRDTTDEHHNEALVAAAVRQSNIERSQIIVATKGGVIRPDGLWVVDGQPLRLQATLRRSFEILGGDTPIDLWQLHAFDPEYSIEETMAVLRDAQREGLIRHIGLSNVSLPQLQLACQEADVVSIQCEYSPWMRAPEDTGILEYCERQGVIFLAYRPLGGVRRHPQLLRIPALIAMAAEKRVSPYVLVLAWLRGQSPAVVPVFGSRRVDHVLQLLPAATICLSDTELSDLSSALKVLRRDRPLNEAAVPHASTRST
jgi:pyridoxine 4-dehydrogenase